MIFVIKTGRWLPASGTRTASHGKVGERAMATRKMVTKVNLRELVAIAN